jgi:hypothetical protein
MNRSLFLAWQAPDRMWFPIGRLDADVSASSYRFGYTRGAEFAAREVGFSPLLAFPDLRARYESSELFPLFKNRVLDPGRSDFKAYLESLDLLVNDPISILALTGGERQTDNLEVFPRIQKREDGSFDCRFFLHGLRHMSPEARERTLSLTEGDELGISLELNNPKTGGAIQLTTRPDYHFVGWTPHYLVLDFLRAVGERPSALRARVVRVNSDDVPLNRRILVEFRGTLPGDVVPMSDEKYQLIAA